MKRLENHHRHNFHRNGFTLLELMVVCGIIAIIAFMSYFGGQQAFRRAQATKIISDFRQIETAWNLWRADTHLKYPLDNIYASAAATNCSDDEALISNTNLYHNTIMVASNWRGPYLTTVLHDPRNKLEYTYDNDGDTYPTSDINGGANVALQWCIGNEIDDSFWLLRNIIDKGIDGTDGDKTGGSGLSSGKFRANTNLTNTARTFIYLLQAKP